jgi:hypothetical protein
MKLILKESQIRKIRESMNNTNPLEAYEKFCGDIINKMNRLYSSVTGLSLIEIIDGSFDINKMSDYLHELQYIQLKNKNAEVYKYLDTQPEGNDLDLRVDELTYLVTNKIDAIELLLQQLSHIKEVSKNKNIINQFNDIEVINVD